MRSLGANPVPVKKHCGWSCKVGKVGGFIKKHQATIAGIAAGAACMAATSGTGTVGCAAIGGWVYGAVSYHQNTPADQQTLLGGFKASLTGAAIEVGLTITGMKAAKIAAPLVKRVAPKIVQRIAARAKGGAPGRGGSAAKTPPAAAKKAGKAAADVPASGGAGCRANSFVPGTSVLMANGSAKAIDKIKVGDKVLATDPATGSTSPQPVLATITRTGAKHLVQLTVDTDGQHGDETGALIATDNHPFWVPTAGKWIDAGKLKPGMWLRTSAGTHVQLTAIKTRTKYQRVHNLTIDDLHTYYVVAGATPVLVHNCETFYRAMSEKESKQLVPNGEIAVKGTENFVTQSRGYLEGLRDRFVRRGGRNAEKYSVLVRYTMPDGTGDALADIGKLPGDIGSDIAAVHLKMERGAQTYGLRPDSVDTFNSMILGFERVVGW